LLGWGIQEGNNSTYEGINEIFRIRTTFPSTVFVKKQQANNEDDQPITQNTTHKFYVKNPSRRREKPRAPANHDFTISRVFYRNVALMAAAYKIIIYPKPKSWYLYHIP
jgi:hypothetical protein